MSESFWQIDCGSAFSEGTQGPPWEQVRDPTSMERREPRLLLPQVYVTKTPLES